MRRNFGTGDWSFIKVQVSFKEMCNDSLNNNFNIYFRNLKTLVVENLPQAKHLEMVAAMLEDQLPELLVIGVDYAKKAEQLRIEGEEVERKLLQAATALEANTINVEPREVPR
jgi:hypothetical protein